MPKHRKKVIDEGATDATRVLLKDNSAGGVEQAELNPAGREDVLDRASFMQNYAEDHLEEDDGDENKAAVRAHHIEKTEQLDSAVRQSKEMTEFTEQAPLSQPSFQAIVKEEPP